MKVKIIGNGVRFEGDSSVPHPTGLKPIKLDRSVCSGEKIQLQEAYALINGRLLRVN